MADPWYPDPLNAHIQHNPIADGWTSSEARPDDPEDRTALERRIQDRLDDLRARDAAAEAARVAADQQVDRLRGEVALGNATANQLHRAKVANAKAQETAANAAAAVRAGERWERAERTNHQQAVWNQSRAIRNEAMVQRAELHARAAAALRTVLPILDELESDAAALNTRYRQRDPKQPVVDLGIAQVRDLLLRRADMLERSAT